MAEAEPESLPIDATGWVRSDTKQVLGAYAWTTRCPDHPPPDDGKWEPLGREECPVEAVCDECSEFLV